MHYPIESYVQAVATFIEEPSGQNAVEKNNQFGDVVPNWIKGRMHVLMQ